MFLINKRRSLIDDVFNQITTFDNSKIINRINEDYSKRMSVEDDVLTMEFEVPGLSKKDIKVQADENHRELSIEGENEKRTFNKKYKLSEEWNIKKTSAEVKDGILKVFVPKVDEKKSKLIEVTVK